MATLSFGGTILAFNGKPIGFEPPEPQPNPIYPYIRFKFSNPNFDPSLEPTVDPASKYWEKRTDTADNVWDYVNKAYVWDEHQNGEFKYLFDDPDETLVDVIGCGNLYDKNSGDLWDYEWDETFYGCTALRSVSGLNFTGITRCNGAFSGCSNLVRVVNADLSSLENGHMMFDGCSSLTTLYNEISGDLDLSKLEEGYYMFSGCASLTQFPASVLSSLENAISMFSDCTGLTSIPNLTLGRLVNAQSMFYGCSSVTTAGTMDLSTLTGEYITGSSPRWDGGAVSMFAGCSSLVGFSGSLDLSSALVIESMFENCVSLTGVTLTTSSVLKNTNSLFSNCRSLRTVNKFNTENVENAGFMFGGCSSLTGSEIPIFDLSNCDDVWGMFRFCTNLVSHPRIDFSHCTILNSLFDGCTSLTAVDIDASSATNINSLCSLCTSLASVSLGDTSNVENIGWAFYGCSSITAIPIDAQYSDSLNYVTNAFLGCSAVTSGMQSLFDEIYNRFPSTTQEEIDQFSRCFGECGDTTVQSVVDEIEHIRSINPAWL